MIVKLHHVFKIFADNHENLMMVYPENSDRDEVDLSINQVLDDLPCFYPSHGKTRMCHMVIRIDNEQDLISVSIDPEPSIKLSAPLYEYDANDAISTNLDDLVIAISNAIQMTFTISLTKFKTIYSKFKLEET